MEKNVVSTFKDQYVQLSKDTGEVLNGAIIDILDDSCIFQTELGRFAISFMSIKDIITVDQLRKRKKHQAEFKV